VLAGVGVLEQWQHAWPRDLRIVVAASLQWRSSLHEVPQETTITSALYSTNVVRCVRAEFTDVSTKTLYGSTRPIQLAHAE